jgi:hypothetical protein
MPLSCCRTLVPTLTISLAYACPRLYSSHHCQTVSEDPGPCLSPGGLLVPDLLLRSLESLAPAAADPSCLVFEQSADVLNSLSGCRNTAWGNNQVCRTGIAARSIV